MLYIKSTLVQLFKNGIYHIIRMDLKCTHATLKRRTKNFHHSHSNWNYEWWIAIVLYTWTTMLVNWFHFRSMSSVFFLVSSCDFWHFLDIFSISLSGVALPSIGKNTPFSFHFMPRYTLTFTLQMFFRSEALKILLQLCDMQMRIFRFVFGIDLIHWVFSRQKKGLFLAKYHFSFPLLWINFSREHFLYSNMFNWKLCVCAWIKCFLFHLFIEACIFCNFGFRVSLTFDEWPQDLYEIYNLIRMSATIEQWRINIRQWQPRYFTNSTCYIFSAFNFIKQFIELMSKNKRMLE